MIFIGTQNIELAKALKEHLQALNSQALIIKPQEKSFIKALYDNPISAVVVDDQLPFLPLKATIDLFNSLSRRVPLIMLTGSKRPAHVRKLSEHITILQSPQAQDILAALGILGGFDKSGFKSYCSAVPYFNIQIPMGLLREHKGLGVITIDASNFSRVGLEYGIDAYTRLKDVFQTILFELWGKAGSFRNTDILCRKSFASNLYYIFLDRSRETGALPYPGSLERVADRLMANIQNALWDELYASRGQSRLHDCIHTIPAPAVGFVGVLDNPCIEPSDIIETGIEDAKKVAVSQVKRLKERQLEFMQTLIQSNDFLKPKFQGIFRLKDITKDQVEESQDLTSLLPLKDAIFGFESLIRIDPLIAHRLISNTHLGITGLSTKYLRPDVLFEMAKTTKVSLELDQACLKHAADYSQDLPGFLMVNILPRNLYYIDRLSEYFSDRPNIIFEVSESEAINNVELLMKSCALLKSKNMDIAADDFGKGFSSLERIIKIKPSVIKFDRSMIEKIHMDPIKQAYVKGMVEAAKILHTTVLAEGVETWEEAEVLQEIGIELVQGFLFHKPQHAHEVTDELRLADVGSLAAS